MCIQFSYPQAQSQFSIPTHNARNVRIHKLTPIYSFDTGSIGAITEMPSFLHTFGELTPIMRGFTVSLIMLTGAFPSFFAGQLADRFGRLAIVMAGALTFLVGAILQGSVGRLGPFLVGRALCGLGEGIWMSTATV